MAVLGIMLNTAWGSHVHCLMGRGAVGCVALYVLSCRCCCLVVAFLSGLWLCEIQTRQVVDVDQQVDGWSARWVPMLGWVITTDIEQVG